MQQRFTGYDSGRNTARNLLDAVRIKNQREATERSLNIAQSAENRAQKLYEESKSERESAKQYEKDLQTSKVAMDDAKKRREMILSNTSGDWQYRLMRYINDNLSVPLINTLMPAPFERETPLEAATRESGILNVQTPDATQYDLPVNYYQSGQVRMNDPAYLLQLLMMNQSNQPAVTQTVPLTPTP
tara:strand:- start:187 stop:747 length:561 start_codon:yes stop_codon:yes gene_type:complete